MAVSGTRDRRPAVWPWVVMPMIVLLAFCVLKRVRERPAPPLAPPPAQATPAPPAAGQ